MSRAGLSELITFVRANAAVGTADYTVNGASYWTDDQIQDALMKWHSRYNQVPLLTYPETDTGNNTVYKNYAPKYGRYFEGTASGSPYWLITDSQGSVISPSTYNVNSTTGQVVFHNNQAGSARFLTAYAYRPEMTISDIWSFKAAHLTAYDFSSNDQTFNRSQLFDQALKMAQRWRDLGGIEYSEVQRSDTTRG